MKKRSGFFSPVFLSIGLILGAARFSGQSLEPYLPSDQETGEWRRAGSPEEFRGDDLYLYIDGGAEIYREYGFDRVIVQDYKNAAGEGFSLEIFRMTDPEAAYGMYTFKRSPNGKPIDIGTEGQLEEYYLNFWKGQFLVTLTGQDSGPGKNKGLTLVASEVAGKIPDGAKRPALVDLLPREGLVEASVRYFRGYLGFMNVYPSLGKEQLRPREGVRGDYGAGCSLFILKYPDEAASGSTYMAAEKAIETGSPAKASGPSGSSFLRCKDDRGKLLSLRRFRNYILVCLEDPASNLASRLFKVVEKAL